MLFRGSIKIYLLSGFSYFINKRFYKRFNGIVGLRVLTGLRPETFFVKATIYARMN